MSTIERAIEKLQEIGGGDRSPVPTVEAPRAFVAVPPASATPLEDEDRIAAAPPAAQDTDSGSRVTLDFERLATAGMVPPDAERSQVAEEFRHIKRPLLLNAFGEGALPRPNRNLIMVTRARPHEGKTFTAINLALSIALERDRTVLLVDADVARPAGARGRGGPGAAGRGGGRAGRERRL